MATAAISATLVFAARRRPLACSLSSSSTPSTRRLVLYSKPGCCLCDGLKEKLNAAFSLSPGSDSLHDVVLQVRDITTNPEWERAYQYEIPVLAKENSDGKEVCVVLNSKSFFVW
ncbi:hypothetical protein CARUB_v10002260mg [Capsella rubella]|uniref:Glutaredoxin-like protein n=1 Tax=Capsella rubella TaxID=81985 RepID=R0FIC6_9BRAS|nr:hypothetical protein CARUB_v10002260mg [Capsella rubella]